MASFNVHWDHHTSSQAQSFLDFLHQNHYTDCILSAEGRTIYAHKIVLASASPVFMELFTITQFIPSVVHMVNGAKFQDLRNVIEFIYSGSIDLKKHQLKAFMELSKNLKVKGVENLEDAYISQSLSNPPLKKSPKRLINKLSSFKKKLSPSNVKTCKKCFKALQNSESCCQVTSFRARRSLNFDIEPMDVD